MKTKYADLLSVAKKMTADRYKASVDKLPGEENRFYVLFTREAYRFPGIFGEAHDLYQFLEESGCSKDDKPTKLAEFADLFYLTR